LNASAKFAQNKIQNKLASNENGRGKIIDKFPTEKYTAI
jgi:hypothetical protein